MSVRTGIQYEIDYVYEDFKPDIRDKVFVGGRDQALKVVSSIAHILHVDPNETTYDTRHEILAMYIDVYIRSKILEQGRSVSISYLQSKYPKLIKLNSQGEEILNYIKRNIEDPSYEISSAKTGVELTSFKNVIAEMRQARVENNTIAENQVEELNYGLKENMPIYTNGVDGSNEYLKHLRTAAGDSLSWNRTGSVYVQGVKGMVDIYESKLPSGEPYKTIYLNMYSSAVPKKAPQGFIYTDSLVSNNPDNNTQKELEKLKKGLNPLSTISAGVSVVGLVFYFLLFQVFNPFTIFLFFFVSTWSLMLPIVAEVARIKTSTGGSGFELAGIAFAGFNFYYMIFGFTQIPIFIGYMGWLVIGILYAVVNKIMKS